MNVRREEDLKNTIERLQTITDASYRDLYFALAFLYDSQYSRGDISELMNVIKSDYLDRG